MREVRSPRAGRGQTPNTESDSVFAMVNESIGQAMLSESRFVKITKALVFTLEHSSFPLCPRQSDRAERLCAC